MAVFCPSFLFFFFNDTATTEIYTLSLHDALPIFEDWPRLERAVLGPMSLPRHPFALARFGLKDRKSTRLNSSHTVISYAVFCLKKKTRTKPDVALMDLVMPRVDGIEAIVKIAASS